MFLVNKARGVVKKKREEVPVTEWFFVFLEETGEVEDLVQN